MTYEDFRIAMGVAYREPPYPWRPVSWISDVDHLQRGHALREVRKWEEPVWAAHLSTRKARAVWFVARTGAVFVDLHYVTQTELDLLIAIEVDAKLSQ